MSDSDDDPADLFDVVGRLDALAVWLAEPYPDHANIVAATSSLLKEYIVLVGTPETEAS